MRSWIAAILSIGTLIGVTVNEADSRGRCRSRCRGAPIYCSPVNDLQCTRQGYHLVHWKRVRDVQYWKWEETNDIQQRAVSTCERDDRNPDQYTLYGKHAPPNRLYICPSNGYVVFWICVVSRFDNCEWEVSGIAQNGSMISGTATTVATCETGLDETKYSLYKQPCPCPDPGFACTYHRRCR